MDELNNRMIMTETRLSELKVVNQFKEQRRKSKRKGQSFRNLGNKTKSLMHMTGVLKKKKENWDIKKYNGWKLPKFGHILKFTDLRMSVNTK